MRLVMLALVAVGLTACPAAEEETCTPGGTRCYGTVIQRCASDGVWEREIDCAGIGENCENSVCTSTGGCTNAETRCSGTAVLTCTSNTWQFTEDCADSGDDCVFGACLGSECTVDEQRCGQNNVAEICNSAGMWETRLDCTPSGSVCVNGWCVAAEYDCASTCSAGSECYFCDNGVAVFCDGLNQGPDYADCNDLLGDGTIAGWCHDFGGSWGADCVLPEGATCAFPISQTDLIWFACGDAAGPSATMGCDLENGCVAGTAVCTAAQDSKYCDGSDYLALGCDPNFLQPILVDCTDYAAACTDFDTSYACVHGNQGEECISGLVECEPSTLTCNDTTDVCDPI